MRCPNINVGSCIYVSDQLTQVIGIVAAIDGTFARLEHVMFRFKRGEWKSMKDHYRDYVGEDVEHLNLCNVDEWDILYDNAPRESFINVEVKGVSV